MAKIFSKFGAKRSEDLGDLRNTVTALNTLLDGIKGGAESFKTEDLDIIRGIFSSDIDETVFASAADTTVEFTGPAGTNITYEPLITLSNRFDRAYFTTSEPFFFGGDGLTARYFNSNSILRSTPGDASTPFLGFDNYFDPGDPTGRPTIDPARGSERADDKNNFWEEGEFVYNQKLSPNLSNFYGGIEWTGFFKPTSNGVWSVRITTTGFIKVEFDTKEAPSKGFTFDPSTGTFRLDDLNFNNGPSGLQTLRDETRLVSAGIIDDISSTGNAVASEANRTYGTITDTQFTYAGAGTGASFRVSRDVNGNPIVVINDGGDGYNTTEIITIPGALVGGEDITITIDDTRGWYIYDEIGAVNTGIPLGQQRTFQVSFGELKAYDPYKIKISFFFDNDAIDKSSSQIQGAIDRRIIFERRSPNGQDDDFDYKYLYPEDYFDFYQIGNFKEFIDESISVGGTRVNDRNPIGIQTSPLGGSAGDSYVGLSNFNPIVSYYVGNFGAVSSITQDREADTIIDSKIITLPDSGINVGLSNKTEFIEVGNYVIGTGIPLGSRISSINLDASIIIDRVCTATGTTNIKTIDHKGLVAFGTNGSYETDIVPSTGLSEDGFALGQRGFDVARIVQGATVDLAQIGQDYGTFEQGVNITSNTDGTGATFNISRSTNGAFVITTLTAGTGYSNYELFEVDAADVGNPAGLNLVFECATLTDTFLTGKPRLIFQKNQIFKNEVWPGTFLYRDKTIPGQEDVGILRTSSQTTLIDRFQTGIESAYSLTENSFVLADQSAALSNANQTWFVYQTFGLNNDGLASYCQGVFDKRILPILKLDNGGSGYVTEALPSGSSVATTGGSGTGLRVYYVTVGTGDITYAWVDPDNAGEGYEPGNTITITGGGGDAQFILDYPDTSSNAVTFRIPDAKDLTTGMVAHLFPSINFDGADVSNLTGVVTITNITSDITASISDGGGNAQDTAALIELTKTEAGGTGNSVQLSPISFVDSVITRITFTPPADLTNKEVCFRPTDTSPPFSATSRGLSTVNDVKMVLDFTSTGGARAGDFNEDSTVSYDKLEMVTDSSNEVATDPNDIITGFVPITDGNGDTYYMLLWRDNV